MWSLPILMCRAAYPYFLIKLLLFLLYCSIIFFLILYYRITDYPLSVVIAERFHPFSFRTRKLSSPAPMVLHGQLCGRVGRRRFLIYNPHLVFCRVRVFCLEFLEPMAPPVSLRTRKLSQLFLDPSFKPPFSLRSIHYYKFF